MIEDRPMIFQSVLAGLLCVVSFLTAYVAKKRGIVVCRDYGDAFFQTVAIFIYLIFGAFLMYSVFGGKDGYVSDNVASPLQNLITVLFIFYNLYVAFIYHRGNWKRVAFTALARVIFVETFSIVLLLTPVIAFNVIYTQRTIFRALNMTPDNGFIFRCLAASAIALILMALSAWLVSRFAFVRKFSNPFAYALPSKIKAVGNEISSGAICREDKEKSWKGRFE